VGGKDIKLTAEVAPHEHGCPDLHKIIKRTSVKDPKIEDVDRLREILQESPTLWQLVGDLSYRVRALLIEELGGSSAFFRESVHEAMKHMEAELEQEGATALEQLLIQQVLLSFVRLREVELRHNSAIHTEGPVSVAVVDFWEKRLSTAERRFFRACETLARTRRLIRQTPAIQVNIAAQGGKQLNVQGSVQQPPRSE
jgi:hypothetical protein